MAHFAHLDSDGVVVNVYTLDNSEIGNKPFPESEPLGQAFFQQLFPESVFKQTSYNGNFRCRYAGVGYTYSEQYDAFIAPKPLPSFVFNETSLSWVYPVQYPTDGKVYEWDEEIANWKLVGTPFTVIGE